MLHAILDADDNVLTVHYNNVTSSMICRCSRNFSKRLKIYSCLNSAKNRSKFSNVMTHNYCHLFMVHNVRAIPTIPIIVTHIQ